MRHSHREWLVKGGCLWVGLLLLGGAASASGAAVPAGLSPDQVLVLRQHGVQLQGIGRWESRSFKQSAWEDVGWWLWLSLSQTADRNATIDRLIETRLVSVLPPVAALEHEREIKKLHRQDGVKPARSAGPSRCPDRPNVCLSQRQVEARRILEVAFAGLLPKLQSWKEKPPASQEDCLQAVIAALRRHQEKERALALLQAVLEQPPWLLKALVADPQPLRVLLTRVQGPHAITKLEELRDPNALRQAAERLRARHLALPSTADEDLLLEKAQEILAKVAELAPELERLTKGYARAVDGEIVDIGAGRSGAPFFRWRVDPAGEMRTQGGDVLVTVELSLCAPLADTKVRPTGAAAWIGSSAAAAIEEIPLGVRISSVRRIGNRLQVVPTGIRSNRTDPSREIEAALRHLGFPAALAFERLEVREIRDFQTLVLGYRVRVPGTRLAADGQLEIVAGRSPEVRSPEARRVLATLIDGMLVSVEQTIAQRLAAEQPKIDLAGAGGLKLSLLRTRGDWSRHQFGFEGELEIKDIGRWTLPLEINAEGGTWALRPVGQAVPGQIVSALRDRLAKRFTTELGAWLGATEAAERLDDLGKRLSIEDVRLALDRARLTGRAVFSGSTPVPVGFEVDLQNGMIKVDLEPARTALLAAATSALQDLTGLDRGLLDGARRCQELGKTKLLIAGTGFTVERSDYDKDRKGCRIDLRLQGTPVAIRKLWLLDFRLDGGEIHAPRADFRDVTIEPESATLLARLAGFDAGPLRVGPPRIAADGLRVTVDVDLPALGGSVSCGEVLLTTGGAKADLVAGLQAGLQKRLTEALGGGRVLLGQAGPVRKLRVTGAELIPEPVVRLEGEIPLGPLTTLKARFQVTRRGVAAKIEPPAMEWVNKLLTDKLPKALGDVKIDRVQVVEAPPYGLTLSGVSFKAWAFSLSLGEVRVTPAGVEIPGGVSVRWPGTVTAPGGFALVQPGVEVQFQGPGKLGLLGDLTLGGKGAEKIAKMDSRLAMSLDIQNLVFALEGRVVLLDKLPLFEVNGQVDLSQAELEVSGRSTGQLARILQLQGDLKASAPRKLFLLRSRIGLLGLVLLEAETEIDGAAARIRASGSSETPLARIKFELVASPDLDSASAAGEFRFGLGEWEIAGARVGITFSSVDLRFHVIGFSVQVLAPSIATLTPDRVLEALLRALDFDLEAFFNAILNREITISFFDGDGRPVGDGDPLPPEEGSKAGPDQENEAQKAAEQGRAPAKEAKTKGGGPKEATRYGAESSSGRGEINADIPEDSIPVETYRYQKTNSVLQFVPGPSGKFLPTLFSLDGRFSWSEHFYVTQQTVNEFKGGRVMLARFYLPLPGSDIQSIPMVCVNGYQHTEVPVYLVWDTQSSSVQAIWMYESQKLRPIPDLPLDLIGDPSKSEANERFKPGDIELLGDLLGARTIPLAPDIHDLERHSEEALELPLADGRIYKLRRPEGYFFLGGDDRAAASLIFQPREGFAQEIARTGDEVFELVRDWKESTFARRLVTFLLDGAHRTLGTEVVWGVPGERALLRLSSLPDVAAGPLLIVLGADGRLSIPVHLTSLDHSLLWMDGALSWKRDDPFARALATQIAGNAWDEVVLSRSDGAWKAILANGLAGQGWRVLRLAEVKDGGITQIQTIGPTSGTAITSRFRQWAEDARFRGAIRREAPHRSLATAEARRWLLSVLVQPRATWPKLFEANPLWLLQGN